MKLLRGYKSNKIVFEKMIVVLIVLLSFLFLWVGNYIATKDGFVFEGIGNAEVASAKVEYILARDVNITKVDSKTIESTTIYFEATFTNGPNKGKRIAARQINDPFTPIQIREVKVNDRVHLVNTIYNSEEKTWILQEYIRTGPLLILAIIFLLSLLLFGGRKGFYTIISLCFTFAAIFAVLIPLVISGYNIYISTIIVCVFIIIMTLALVNGLNKKSLSAAIGCMGGLVVSGIIVAVMDGILALTGFVNEESAYLIYMNPENPIDLKAMVFAGILIGALGAMLDVAVSVASALSEISEASEVSSFSNLVKSGFNLGRDILGTMTNTLVLAYIGSTFSLILLLVVYSNSLTELLNREMIIVEILQALTGSIGLLFAIPLTTLSAAYIYTKYQN